MSPRGGRRSPRGAAVGAAAEPGDVRGREGPGCSAWRRHTGPSLRGEGASSSGRTCPAVIKRSWAQPDARPGAFLVNFCICAGSVRFTP